MSTNTGLIHFSTVAPVCEHSGFFPSLVPRWPARDFVWALISPSSVGPPDPSNPPPPSPSSAPRDESNGVHVNFECLIFSVLSFITLSFNLYAGSVIAIEPSGFQLLCTCNSGFSLCLFDCQQNDTY